MRKYSFFLFIAFLINSLELSAQDCKPDKETLDKFTRNKIAYYKYGLKGKWNILSDVSYDATFAFALINDSIIQAVIILTRSAPPKEASLQPLKIKQGSSVFIANNKQSVKLFCMEDAISNSHSSLVGSYVDQELYASYDLKRTDLETFSDEIFDQILIEMDGSPAITATIKSKSAEKMKQDALCLSNRLK